MKSEGRELRRALFSLKQIFQVRVLCFFFVRILIELLSVSSAVNQFVVLIYRFSVRIVYSACTVYVLHTVAQCVIRAEKSVLI